MNLSELDFYNILNVPRNSTKEDITKAYRKLAIKLCPLRDSAQDSPDDVLTHMNPLPLRRQWEYINIAYDALGKDLHREVYDRYGEAGLLHGVPLPDGFFPPYQYHGDPMRVYHEVFGSYSPYANIIDSIVERSPPLYSNKSRGIGVRLKSDPVMKEIFLDLEEVYHGCIKLMHVMRQEFVDENEKRTEKKKKSLTLHIPAGVTAGTRFCFKEEGDRIPTKTPSDIIFIVQDKPHPQFKRINQHDILMKHQITLCQALTGFRFNVCTLDKRKLTVSVSDVVAPGFKKIIPGEGLPVCKPLDVINTFKNRDTASNGYGDLIIEFPITFPKYLTAPMKQITRNFFKDLTVLEEHAGMNDC